MLNQQKKIRGRFAPSPTGPLHFGSLVAALASYLNSKSEGGEWLVRVEDIDPPREQAGATDAILRALEIYGLEWDGPVLYQSQRSAAYQKALDQLSGKGLTYYCTCSRKLLGKGKGQHGSRYPGYCRSNTRAIKDSSIRLRTHNRLTSFNDQHMGVLPQKLESVTGDFIIRRRDGLFAYHLAVVVDDAEQEISEVVRGYDLFELTPLHIYLQQCLDLPTPDYLHLPLAVTRSGTKLSKQNLVEQIDMKKPAPTLIAALRFLGQTPPADLYTDSVTDIMNWARGHWSSTNIPSVSKIVYEKQ